MSKEISRTTAPFYILSSVWRLQFLHYLEFVELLVFVGWQFLKMPFLFQVLFPSFLPHTPTSVSLTSLCVVHAVLRLQCSCLSLLRPGFPDMSLSLGLKSVISSAVPSCLCHNSCLCHLQSSVKLTKICVFLKRKNWIFPLFLLLFVC